jgi:hypothetical protein
MVKRVKVFRKKKSEQYPRITSLRMSEEMHQYIAQRAAELGWTQGEVIRGFIAAGVIDLDGVALK